jgi:hypothetical protein
MRLRTNAWLRRIQARLMAAAVASPAQIAARPPAAGQTYAGFSCPPEFSLTFLNGMTYQRLSTGSSGEARYVVVASYGNMPW